MRITRRRKGELLYSCIGRGDKAFIHKNVPDDVTYDAIVKWMVNEYNSDTRKIQVRGKLELLRIRKFIAENEKEGNLRLYRNIDCNRVYDRRNDTTM